MKYKHIMSALGIAAVIGFILRTRQEVLTLDSRGFVLEGAKSDNFFLILYIIAFFILPIIAAFFTRRCPVSPPKINLPLSISSAALGIWMAYEAVTLQSPVSVPAWQSSILIFFGVLSGLFLMAYALTFVIKFPLPDILFILPVAYWMSRLIWIFTSLNTLTLTIEHILLLLNCSTVLLFMLQVAKLANSIDRKKSYKRIMVTAFATILTTVDYALVNIILEFAGFKTNLNGDVSSEALLLLAGIFTTVYTLSYFDQHNLKTKHRKHKRTVANLGTVKDGFYIGD